MMMTAALKDDVKEFPVSLDNVRDSLHAAYNLQSTVLNKVR